MDHKEEEKMSFKTNNCHGKTVKIIQNWSVIKNCLNIKLVKIFGKSPKR